MKPEIHEQLARTTHPRALAESIYAHCAPWAPLSRIDLICNEREARPRIACFVETPSMHAARQLALHLGATVFGIQGVLFELAHGAGFVCSPFQHNGDDTLPVRVNFDCLRR